MSDITSDDLPEEEVLFVEMVMDWVRGNEIIECTMCGQIMDEMTVTMVKDDAGIGAVVACDNYTTMMLNQDRYEPNKEYILPCTAVVSTYQPDVNQDEF